MTIGLKNEQSPVWEFRRTLRKGLGERYSGTVFTFQPADLTAKILNFGSPSPIDVQINGMDLQANYAFARKLQGKLRKISGTSDVTIQQTMRTPTLMVNGNRSLGLNIDLPLKDVADNMLLSTSGSQQIDQQYWLDHKTGMSYQVNIYTPQPRMTRIEDLLTVPVDTGKLDASRENNVQLLGNVATLTATGTPGVVTHQDIMPLIDVYVSAEGRDLGSVLADVEDVVADMKDQLQRSFYNSVGGTNSAYRSDY